MRVEGHCPELALEQGGVAKLLVEPEEIQLVLHMLREGALRLRASDIVVSDEYKDVLDSVVARLPYNAKVKPVSSTRLDLSPALASVARVAGRHGVSYPLAPL